MNILFITHNRLGDAVLSTCLLHQVLTQYPNASVTVATGPIPAPLFEAIPQVVRCIIVKKQSYERHWLKLFWQTLWTRWHMVIDCRGSALAYLLWTRKRYCRYDRKTKTEHRIKRYASLLKLDTLPSPKIWLSAAAKDRAKKLAQNHTTIIAIAPAANWRAKTWRAEYFSTLIKRLTEANGPYPNASIMVITAPQERQSILPLLSAIPKARCIDLSGTETLTTIAACLPYCTLFVGNDSGLMHMAAASGIRTLGLFGPSNPTLYAPFGQHCDFICTTQSPETLMGPGFDHRHSDTLMDSLSVNTVFEKIVSLQDCTDDCLK